ncbi:hypothetical protein B1A99_29205 [Cohnella sp. CIP 111063]|uniref:alpha-mannosidase n=1 Tax=unclassified Cohnella TaxID=2636738 RepID=UPI000B8BCC63|nr:MULTISPECIES: glycosyl hydrolase-related protein [unclassified Cohnella]OXS53732.1 hypothetical protein B1A99_29205 [Cohnella sp. CIP 111063]PRX62018.1 alpha-mannosidase/mannosylglycerate hydrolase [Cohnella sp. SGD-V74]
MINVHIVPHTHWDREWYLPYQEFRIRLTRLVGKLLTILEQDPEYVSFHLDGQSSVLDDYLEVHPEDRERLKRCISDGKIKVGPWYVQPDEALVSGESLIRNFQLGIRMAEEMGGSQRFGYLPDMFGHISQLPQILAGFDMKEAVFWRGLGDVAAKSGTELLWQGADGTTMFAYRFPNAIGYNSVFRLHTDVDKAEQQLRELLDVHLLPPTQASSVLVMVGVDHMEPQNNLTEIVRQLAPRFPGFKLIHSTMERFLAETRADVEEKGASLYTAVGELRDTNRMAGSAINFLLANVLSSRMPLKQFNAKVQHELERWAEPFSAVWHGMGGDYPGKLLGQSWKYLLQNHPHDSICGCSRDEVHRQMMTRFEWAQEIAQQLTDESLRSIAVRIDTSALPEEAIVFHVFNPLEHSRKDTVTVELLLPDVDADIRFFEIRDSDGRLLPSQWVDLKRELIAGNHHDAEVRDLGLLEAAVPPEEKGILVGLAYVRKATVRFAPAELPALGYATFTAVPVRHAAMDERSLVDGYALENDWLRVEANRDGSVHLWDKATGRKYENLLVYEDGGDIGDGYTFSPPLFDERFSTSGLQASLSVAEDGPARGTIRIEQSWLLPVGLDNDRRRRSAAKRECRLTTEISLGRHDRWVGVVTLFDNRVNDHRLRLKLATGIHTEQSWSSSAFDVVKRSTRVVQPASDQWIEDAVGAYPNQGLAGITSACGTCGFAVAPYGLPEYEATPEGELAVTLVRSVGYLGSPDVRTIRGGAGPGFAAPEAQCQGQLTFRLALIPFSGDGAQTGEARRASAEHHLPARAVQMRRHAGTMPLVHSFARFDPPDSPVALSAVKKAEARDGTIIRCFNPTESEQTVSLRLDRPVKEAYVLDLEENRKEAAVLVSADGLALTLRFKPKQIITVEAVQDQAFRTNGG